VFSAPIVTTLEPLTEFYTAEQYHQDYVKLHPDQPYIVQTALPKVEKVCKLFPDQIKNLPEPKAR
jgi:peptide-methionine (S)-S-oxide reductase